MGFSAIAAATVASAAYAGDKTRKAANTQADAARDAAATAAAAEQENLRKQTEETQRLQADQQNFETQRQQAQQEQAQQLATSQAQAAAERQAQLEASAKQTASDSAMSVQNQRVSDLTPTVQVAAEGVGEDATNNQRNRRAQFRPEYTSGVTI